MIYDIQGKVENKSTNTYHPSTNYYSYMKSKPKNVRGKSINRNKWSYFIMVKCPIHLQVIIILNICSYFL